MVVITSFREPESPVQLRQSNITVYLDKRNLGTGTLIVSERTLCWQNQGDIGFAMDYENITLHAVSRDPNVFRETCIYMITDPHIELPGGGESLPSEVYNDGDSGPEEPDISEIILVPENPDLIPAMYESIKLCQELNPDPNDEDDEDDDGEGDDLYTDAEEVDMIEPESVDDMDDLAARLQGNNVDSRITHHQNGNNDNEDFADAD